MNKEIQSQKINKEKKQSSVWVKEYQRLLIASNTAAVSSAVKRYIWLSEKILDDAESFQKRILWSFARFNFLTDYMSMPVPASCQQESETARQNLLFYLREEFLEEAEKKKFIGKAKARILRNQGFTDNLSQLVARITLEQFIRQYKNFKKKTNQKLLNDLLYVYGRAETAYDHKEILDSLRYATTLAVKPSTETKELRELLKHYNRLIKKTFDFKGGAGIAPDVLVLPSDIIEFVAHDVIDRKHKLLLFSKDEASRIIENEDYGESEEEFICSLIHLYQEPEEDQIGEFFELGVAEIIYQTIRPYGNTIADSQAAKQVCQALIDISKSKKESLELEKFFIQNDRFEQICIAFDIQEADRSKVLIALRNIYKQAAVANLSDDQVKTAMSFIK